MTMESAAAMQPTRPGVAYTAQSALVCATISPSDFGASGALVPNERSMRGVGSQLDEPAASAGKLDKSAQNLLAATQCTKIISNHY